MPEGHTLHRLARLHQRRYAGAPVRVSSPQGRFTDAAVVDGLTFTRASAWGKHLFHHYEGGPIVHVHLGLYGTFRESRTPLAAPVGQVRMRICGAEYGTDLRGPTACEVIDEAQQSAILNRLGPDPLRSDARPDEAWARITKSRKAIGALLMDQSVLAGVGNVYRAEALHVEGLHPSRAGRSLSRGEFDGLWATICRMLRDGERAGRIITVTAADAGVPRSRLPRGQRTYVYRQRQCRTCGTPVRAWEMAGRRAWACEQCQS